MLDYAANGSKYWPVATLRQFAGETAAAAAVGTEDAVVDDVVDPVERLWPGVDVEEFWRKVATNLDAGRVRLLFVADAIPAELARIIEFLNEQMSPAEVLGVELRQYVGGEHIAYVPRLIGQTTRAQDVKDVAGTRQIWTEETLLQFARDRLSDAEIDLIERLLADTAARGGQHRWGRDATAGVSGRYPVAGQLNAVWYLNLGADAPGSRGYLYIYLPERIAAVPDRGEQALAALSRIPAMKPKIDEARASGWNRQPTLNLSDAVADPASVQAVFEAITALADPAAAAPGGPTAGPLVSPAVGS